MRKTGQFNCLDYLFNSVFEDKSEETLEDPGITWLTYMMARRFVMQKQPPYSSKTTEEIINLACIKRNSKKRIELEALLKPLAAEFQATFYKPIFDIPANIPTLVSAFNFDERRIVDVVFPFLCEALEETINELYPAGKAPESLYLDRFDILCRTFELNGIEREILAVCLLDNISSSFNNMANGVYEPRSHYTISGVRGLKRLSVLSLFSSFPTRLLMSVLKEDSNLRRLGFINCDFDPSPDMLHFLINLKNEPLSDRYFKAYEGDVLPLERLMIEHSDVVAICSILSNRQPGQGVNFLIGGPPGVGKTETVRSLARTIGFKLYEINSQQTQDAESSFRIRALFAAQNLIGKGENAAVLIDEADNLLCGSGIDFGFGFIGKGSASVDKGVVNEALDRSTFVQFWVSNNLTGIHPSTRRRFDYAVKYERATISARQSIWQTVAERYELDAIITPDEQKRLAKNYAIDAGGIDSVLRNTAHLIKLGWQSEDIIAHVEQLLQAHSRFSPQELVVQSSDLEVVVVSPRELNISPASELEAVLEIIEKIKMPQHNCTKQATAMNILFSGSSGTGKSHLAKHLAEQLNRPLHYKTGSQILDKFVGEAEKNIREAFQNAAREGAVLFFDEIDSLLRNREGAMQRWEVSQVNELLSAMESFKGIFIAATNFDTSLDKACLRRFHFQLHFDSLSATGVLAFYKALLMPLSEGDFGELEEKALSAISGLVPSDFGSLRDRLLLQSKRLRHSHLITGLRERRDTRCGQRKPKIGFNALKV